jgi:TRAP-type transport system periplasmic protein
MTAIKPSRRTFLRSSAAVGAAATFGAPLIARADAKFEIKMATLAPENSTWMKAFKALALEIKEKTDGAVKFRFYAGGVLGDEGVMIRKIRTGQIDGAAVTNVGLGTINKQLLMLQLPLLFKNYNQLDRVRDKMSPTFASLLEKEGFTIGAWGDVGFIYIFSNTPIKVVSDIKKTKMWVWSMDPTIKKVAEVVGVNGVELDLPDVLPSLQTGMIDAFTNSPYGAIALQWYTKAQYVTNLRMSMGIGASVLSMKTWESLDDDIRAIMTEATASTQKKLLGAIRKSNQKAVTTLQEKGLQVVEPENFLEWANTAVAVRNELTKSTFDPALVDQMLEYIKSA